MAVINGRITITASDLAEYTLLRQQAIDEPQYAVVSENQSALNLVVDINGG